MKETDGRDRAMCQNLEEGDIDVILEIVNDNKDKT